MSEDAKKKLADIRAKREAMARARELRAEQSADEQELETESRALADDEAIERLEGEHGPVGKKLTVVRTRLGAVIFKKPTNAAWRKHLDEQLKLGHADTTATEKLVRQCRVYPDVAAFEEILDEYPGSAQPFYGAVALLAKGGADETSSK
jgi:hypothetical protein